MAWQLSAPHAQSPKQIQAAVNRQYVTSAVTSDYGLRLSRQPYVNATPNYSGSLVNRLNARPN